MDKNRLRWDDAYREEMYNKLDCLIIKTIIAFCKEHSGNGPLLQEIVEAISESDQEELAGVSAYGVGKSLDRLEERDLIHRHKSEGETKRYLSGRIEVVGALWHYPEFRKEGWPCENTP